MDLNRESFLLLAVAIGGACNHRQAPAVTLPVAPSTTPAAQAVACDAMAKHNKRILATPTDACNTGQFVEDAKKVLLNAAAKDPLFTYCKEGRGTWFVELTSATVGPPAEESGACFAHARYRLVFAPRAGARVSSSVRAWGQGDPDDHVQSTVRYQLDFDGDGNDEIVLENGGYEPSVDVLQATRTGVGPYPIGFGVDGLTDADSAGRPSFISQAFFRTEEPCVGLRPVPRYGVPLLVHALPDGTFSMSDAVARTWALKQCPTPRGDPSCARLWGVSVAEIAKAASSADVCGTTEREVVTKLVTREPPLRLATP
jgi:hypothetical protein